MTIKKINDIVSLIVQSRRILFITGAGISAESGLPTYRGVGGLYDNQNTADGYRIEEALSAPMLRLRPEITWKYLWQIGSARIHARPNRAHEVIAAIENSSKDVWTLTQNVDGFHRAAGSNQVIEIHGDAFDLFCTGCYAPYDAEKVFRSASGGDYVLPDIELPPKCERCGAIVRPNVVLFGEMLPQGPIIELVHQLNSGFDLVFSIGTSNAFPYISEPVIQAIQLGIPTVEINPSETSLSSMVDIRLSSTAAAVMDEVWQKLHGCL
ncbi:MAG: NAD-dependent protein deacylase [Proteobacteria bacterium]|nr:MAG: NAD-dependent protein deacylase [Pseudomonadota bacterium]